MCLFFADFAFKFAAGQSALAAVPQHSRWRFMSKWMRGNGSKGRKVRGWSVILEFLFKKCIYWFDRIRSTATSRRRWTQSSLPQFVKWRGHALRSIVTDPKAKSYKLFKRYRLVWFSSIIDHKLNLYFILSSIFFDQLFQIKEKWLTANERLPPGNYANFRLEFFSSAL